MMNHSGNKNNILALQKTFSRSFTFEFTDSKKHNDNEKENDRE